jgi:hypothetical protein
MWGAFCVVRVYCSECETVWGGAFCVVRVYYSVGVRLYGACIFCGEGIL